MLRVSTRLVAVTAVGAMLAATLAIGLRAGNAQSAAGVTSATYKDGWVAIRFVLSPGGYFDGADMVPGDSPPSLTDERAWRAAGSVGVFPYDVTTTGANLHVGNLTPGGTYWIRVHDRGDERRACAGARYSLNTQICYLPAARITVPAATPTPTPSPRIVTPTATPRVVAPTATPRAAAPAPAAPSGGSSSAPRPTPSALPTVPPVGSAVPATPGASPTSAPNRPAAKTTSDEICAQRTAQQWRDLAGRTENANGKTQANACAQLVTDHPELLNPNAARQPAEQPLPPQAEVARGKLQVTRPGANQATEAETGQQVAADQVLTALADDVVLAFEGGSRVEPSRGAVLRIEPAGGEVEQKKGRVFFDIRGRKMTVKVQRPGGSYTVAVRGTQFFVDVAEDGRGTVEVTEGTVEVMSASESRLVSAGEAISVAPGQRPYLAGESRLTAGKPVLIASGMAAVLIAGGLAGLVLTRRRRASSGAA